MTNAVISTGEAGGIAAGGNDFRQQSENRVLTSTLRAVHSHGASRANVARRVQTLCRRALMCAWGDCVGRAGSVLSGERVEREHRREETGDRRRRTEDTKRRTGDSGRSVLRALRLGVRKDRGPETFASFARGARIVTPRSRTVDAVRCDDGNLDFEQEINRGNGVRSSVTSVCLLYED